MAMVIRVIYLVWWQLDERHQIFCSLNWCRHRVDNQKRCWKIYSSCHDIRSTESFFLSIKGIFFDQGLILILFSVWSIHILIFIVNFGVNFQGYFGIRIFTTRITWHKHVWILSVWWYSSISWSAQINVTNNGKSRHIYLPISNKEKWFCLVEKCMEDI